MKNIIKRASLLAVAAVAALLAASCQKEELGRILTATIEQYEHNAKGGNGGVMADSKAYINADHYACWESGDLVSINGTQCSISVLRGDEHNYSATIQGEIPTDVDLMAFYPAGMVSNLSATGGTVTLPQVQTYKETTVGGVTYQKIQNPMAAYCSADGNELKFRNLAALLKVTIQAPAGESLGVKAILVKGDDGQMLWGTAPLTLDNQHRPMLEKMSNGSTTVCLSFETPAEISTGARKSFYIVVPAGSNFFNFTIHVITNEKGFYRKESKLGQSLHRNEIGALTYTPDEADADNVSTIFYGGSIQGFRSDALGGAQVELNEGGILIFDRILTTIGERAFQDCSGLTSIDLSNTRVTSIGDYAFQKCSGLESIVFPTTLTSIGNYAFDRCSSLTGIDLSNTRVTSIGNYAFNICSGLGSIVFPTTLTTIGNYAFRNCSGLTSIDLSNTRVTSIGNYAFNICSGLGSIVFPTTLTSIGISAFAECSKLASITLPPSVNSIGSTAFYYCSSLVRVDCYAQTPPTVNDRSFVGISSEAVLHVPSGYATAYSSTNWGEVIFSGEGRIIGDLQAN